LYPLFSKRGQVTLFIIIGLVVIATFAGIYVVKKDVIFSSDTTDATPNAAPLESVVARCLDSTAITALELLGIQGGYVKVPQSLSASFNTRLELGPGFVIPYWAVGMQKSIPTLVDIKKDIDAYVEENVVECVKSDGAFKKRFVFEARDDPKSDVTIGNDRVVFNLAWNIVVQDKTGSKVTEATEHKVTKRHQLKRMHETASTIIDFELTDQKIEDLTQDLLAFDVESVPLSGIEVSCTAKKWPLPEVKEGVQELLRNNLRELKVQGTKFTPHLESQPYYKAHYVWDFTDEFSQPDIEARFDFQPTWPMTFDVAPSSGGYLSSAPLAEGLEMAPFYCLQNWKFTYTIHYPIRVELRDKFNNVFQMAFMVHLNRNIPDRASQVSGTSTQLPASFSDEEFCAKARIPMRFSTFKIIDNPDTGAYVRDPLDAVNLSFLCLRSQCDLGQSQYGFLDIGNSASVQTTVPFCAGAYIKATKEGFMSDPVRAYTKENREIEINLKPIKKISSNRIEILKHSSGQSAGIKMAGDEQAIITLTYNPIQPGQDAPAAIPLLEQRVALTPSLDIDLQKFNKLTFLAEDDFTYDLDIQIFKENTFTGGYKAKWTPNWVLLSQAQRITFHVVDAAGKKDTQLFDMLANLENASATMQPPEIQ